VVFFFAVVFFAVGFVAVFFVVVGFFVIFAMIIFSFGLFTKKDLSVNSLIYEQALRFFVSTFSSIPCLCHLASYTFPAFRWR
jgi:hypothetical protein